MASTINSDNGVVSGSVGLKYASDNSGVLALQTNGNTAVTITSANNVGIGTTSPQNALEVKSTTGTVVTRLSCGSGSGREYGLASNTDGDYGVYDYTGSTYCSITNRYGIGLGSQRPSSGLGIMFPATQSASTDPNTLDDYEEGTFSPYIDSAVAGSGRNTTVYNAKYTKIGRICQFQLFVTIGTLGSGGSGNATIYGLPFTSVNDAGNCECAINVGYFDTLNSTITYMSGLQRPNSTNITLQGLASAAISTTGLTFSSYIKAGTTFIVSGTYTVA